MGYPNLKNLRNWAGLRPDPEEDTNPNIPLFNWDDVDLEKPKPKMKAQSYTASIEISMYVDVADSKMAQAKALQEFIDISGCLKEEVKYTHLRKEEENILFSSVKKVYTIEITASKMAVMAYYKSLKKRFP
tara:strand:- start:518 stop:910 length:393 start_codon:yes stop_codon:yes gene_type:complete